MALLNNNSREKLIARATLRVPKIAESYSGGLAMGEFLGLVEQFENLEGEEAGMVMLKGFKIIDEFTRHLFAEDYKAVLKLSGDKLDGVMEIITTVLSSPLAQPSLQPSAGAEAARA